MKEKILYIYPEDSAFIRKDISFLSERYRVVTPGHDWKRKSMTPINFLKQLLFLFRHLHGTRALFIMFGGYWSLLPALLGRITGTPVYIIPGGTDCVSFPSLNYGSLRKPVMRTFIRWSFQLCHELLPVDESLVLSDYSFLEQSDYPKQGYKYFFPEITTPFRVINNGFDPDYFNSDPGKKVDNSFIVLASVTSMTRLKVKGIDLVLYLAGEYSQATFTIIGITEEIKSRMGIIPANVTIYPFLPAERFITLLEVSQFVLQLSVSEGFPNALCEAMLCHCIPVGSSVGAIPHIIGDTGYIIRSSGKEYLLNIFDEIMGTDRTLRDELGRRARKRIAEDFHISKRERAFFDLIESAIVR
ncbi:MAG: glycosyltransferase family 4 protein [Bacteroidales bacterium]|jgi:glycosyltransferase involved in cell wall biosynthesis|nr:glycosyltransferase family 4 protein [Bacteroidales bacterium]